MAVACERLLASPETEAWWARANTLRYDHYSEGIVYSQYDNGDPIREIPEESKGTDGMG
jgi:urease accessory protein UreH